MKTPFPAAALRFCRCALSVRLLALTLLALLALPGGARAQLTFIISPDTQSARLGNVLTFAGTLTNQGTDELFLNGDNFTLPGSDFTLDDSLFLTNFPLSLLGGEVVSGDLFTMTMGPNVPVGFYTGSFTILGGPSSGDFTDLATQRFDVTAVPEPGTLVLLLSGGSALGCIARRQKC